MRLERSSSCEKDTRSCWVYKSRFWVLFRDRFASSLKKNWGVIFAEKREVEELDRAAGN